MSPLARAGALGLAMVMVAACAPAAVVVRPGGGAAALPGRVLVVARQTDPANRGIGARAAELMAQGLRPAGEVWSAEDLLGEAAAAGATASTLALLARLSAGGWPSMDERLELLRFAVTGVIATDVTAYEQVWGKYAKFTRVGVEARAFDVAAGGVVWRLHRAVEIEATRGRAFEQAVEHAVGGLVAAVMPGTTYSAIDLWRVWRR